MSERKTDARADGDNEAEEDARQGGPTLRDTPTVAPHVTDVALSGQQAGGTILLDTGQVAYTHEGAVPAVAGGPPDPTIIPGQFDPPPTEGTDAPTTARQGRAASQGVNMIEREDAAPLTGDPAPSEKK
jgi:hypothetical protein